MEQIIAASANWSCRRLQCLAAWVKNRPLETQGWISKHPSVKCLGSICEKKHTHRVKKTWIWLWECLVPMLNSETGNSWLFSHLHSRSSSRFRAHNFTIWFPVAASCANWKSSARKRKSWKSSRRSKGAFSTDVEGNQSHELMGWKWDFNGC